MSAINLTIFLKIINLIRILPIVKRSNLNLNLSNSQCSSLGALWTIGYLGGPYELNGRCAGYGYPGYDGDPYECGGDP